MKPGIHPDYHKVLFVDSATGQEWLSRSTLTSKAYLKGVEAALLQAEK